MKKGYKLSNIKDVEIGEMHELIEAKGREFNKFWVSVSEHKEALVVIKRYTASPYTLKLSYLS